MPNTPSAKSSLKKSLKRRERNRGRRSAMRTWIKRTLDSVEEGNLQSAETNFAMATKLIDKNVKWNQMHTNNAARKKSHLAKAVDALR
ncbi:MAG: 30S ribosomal protein S20 [Planctomycetota bacterium]|nr:MAG: 30S ribosomal protein S20 [Planctomycetota bacterium]